MLLDERPFAVVGVQVNRTTRAGSVKLCLLGFLWLGQEHGRSNHAAVWLGSGPGEIDGRLLADSNPCF